MFVITLLYGIPSTSEASYSKGEQSTLRVYFFSQISNYSGDLNTGLVCYSNGQKLFDHRMVHYSHAI